MTHLRAQRNPLFNRCRGGLLGVLAGLAFAAGASAHDFWLQPGTFRPVVGATVPIEIMTGHAGEAESRPRDPNRIVKFVVAGPEGTTSVPGIDGQRPAGMIRPTAPGPHVLAYESNHAVSELPPEKFEAYLREVGLERIVELRAAQGAQGATQREKYMRCAKTIVGVGTSEQSGGDSGASRSALLTPAGLRLELVPKRIPAGFGDGTLDLVLQFEGKPIEGVLVVVETLASGEPVAQARTAADGAVSLRLPRDGAWLVTAVHMVPAPKELDSVWESIWASLTLEIKAR